MIATKKKSARKVFPRRKISTVLRSIIPNGQPFKLMIADSEIGKLKVVRIITPAWKNQRPWQRIAKVLEAVDGKLTPAEEKQILRYSVLTPEENRRIL